MTSKSKIHYWLQAEEPWLDPTPAEHYDYASEGDEYLDDALRILDQPFYQIDGSFALSETIEPNVKYFK